MCILKIEKSSYDDTIVFVNADPNDWNNDSIDNLITQMEQGGFNNCIIACWNAYENCISFC